MKKLTKTWVDLEHAAFEKTRAETELKKQVDDLKRRLAMGAEEYKKKYLECKKWQKKMEKIKKERCKLINAIEILSNPGKFGILTDICVIFL